MGAYCAASNSGWEHPVSPPIGPANKRRHERPMIPRSMQTTHGPQRRRVRLSWWAERSVQQHDYRGRYRGVNRALVRAAV